MYLAIRTASQVSDGKVTSTDKRIIGVELSTDVPAQVTSANEYVYVDLSTVSDMVSYVNSIINNLDTASIMDNPSGTQAISSSRVALGGSKTDRTLDTWDGRIPQSWTRALSTVNFTNL